MPGDSGSPNASQRRRARRRGSNTRRPLTSHVPPVDTTGIQPSSQTRPQPMLQAGHSSTEASSHPISPLSRHRMTRRRDHDPPGMRIEDALRELDAQSNALSSALREPLPQIMMAASSHAPAQATGAVGHDASQRAKRRKLDQDGLSRSMIPYYGYAGRVVPGKLQMRVDSCGCGPYGGKLASGFNGSKVEWVLDDNDLTFTTESTRCNLVLKHFGDTTFSLTKVVIKSPLQGFDARLQEGLIFVAMDKDGLAHRTERYDVQKGSSGWSKSARKRARRERAGRDRNTPNAGTSRQGVEWNQPSSSSSRPANQRHNSWQQLETPSERPGVRASIPAESADSSLPPMPSSPHAPYAPVYMSFSVTTSPEQETPQARQNTDDGPPMSAYVGREYLDDLMSRIASNSDRMDDQRAPPPRRRLPQFRDLVASVAEPPNVSSHEASARSGQTTRVYGSLHGRQDDTISSSDLISSDLTSPDSTSGDEEEEEEEDQEDDGDDDDEDDELADGAPLGMGGRRRNAENFRLRNLEDQQFGRHTGPVGAPSHSFLYEDRPSLRRRRRGDGGIWRHSDRRRPLSEPRPIKWYPNKVAQSGLGAGPSGVPDMRRDAQRPGATGAINSDADGSGPLRPHARFFIHRDDKGVAVHFDPPVTGRYILLKIWAPPHADSIDVQEISAYGFAGPRLFPKIEFM